MRETWRNKTKFGDSGYSSGYGMLLQQADRHYGRFYLGDGIPSVMQLTVSTTAAPVCFGPAAPQFT